MIRLLSGLGLFLFFLAGGGWAATTAPVEAFRRGDEI